MTVLVWMKKKWNLNLIRINISRHFTSRCMILRSFLILITDFKVNQSGVLDIFQKSPYSEETSKTSVMY